ncbi:stage IV sporulation protein FB [Clostridium moniliforme]|uniref:Stage IV sporulation protein FB n=1 Tax=Clostridium moniliforme TaxID=39489 RepID=A0ABS4F2I6_9CLOT|nr:site-2 protease family protein [Clostridium moniliforme]MBP1890464.1 stage IV sporulation protein FB [Clostridium moniliforme]
MRKSYKLIIIEFILLLLAISFESKVLIGVISIILHEFTHIFVGNRLGCKLSALEFGLTGAKAEITNIEDLLDKEKLILYLSGPTMNLFLGVSLFCLYKVTSFSLLEVCYSVNFSLFIFNLIPAYPLDGSRILELIFSKYISYMKSKKITTYVSYFFSTCFIILFLIMIFLHRVNISLFLIGILIIYSTILEKKWTMYIIMGDIIKKRRKLEKYNFIENKTISVFYKNELLDVMRMLDKSKFNTFYILDEELKLLKIIHEDEILEGLKNYGNITLEEYINICKI